MSNPPKLYDNDDLGLDDVDLFSSAFNNEKKKLNTIKSQFVSTTIKLKPKFKFPEETPAPSSPEPPAPGVSDIFVGAGRRENGSAPAKPNADSGWFAAANAAATAAAEAAASSASSTVKPVSQGKTGSEDKKDDASEAKSKTSEKKKEEKDDHKSKKSSRKSRSKSPARRKRSRSRSPRSRSDRDRDRDRNRDRDRLPDQRNSTRYVPGRYMNDYAPRFPRRDSTRTSPPRRNRSRSPNRNRNHSRSPNRMRSRSPNRMRSRSPNKMRSRSPNRMRSRSPIRGRSRSPNRMRSRSPNRMRSRSPKRMRSRSPHRSGSPPRPSSNAMASWESFPPDSSMPDWHHTPSPAQPPMPVSHWERFPPDSSAPASMPRPEWQHHAPSPPAALAPRPHWENFPPDSSTPDPMPIMPVERRERPEWQPPKQPAPPPPAATWDPTVYEQTPSQVAYKLAVEKEALQQKQAFIDQRRDYILKRDNLLEELELLKTQRRDMGTSKDPEVIKLNEENIKLQEEIIRKVKSVDNVLDMLTGLIGDDFKIADVKKERPPDSPKIQKETKKNRSSSKSSSEEESSKKKDKEKKKSKKKKKEEAKEEATESKQKEKTKAQKGAKATEQNFNFVYFDPELHWCRPCIKFPATAKEYLLHLHSAEHLEKTQEQKLAQYPWHEDEEQKAPEVKPGLHAKRVPIKGLQFFVPASAWYCKLCKTWIGDLHCSSVHLKSEEHNLNYQAFIDKHPQWETSWKTYREQALKSGKRGVDLKRQLEEQLELIKKQEEIAAKVAAGSELPATDLLMPLTINTKKRDTEKKTAVKKKKRRRSRSSSSSSSSTSSSDEDKKKKKKKKPKDAPVVKISLPEKSKWENDEEETEIVRPTIESPADPTDMNINKMRSYRHATERNKDLVSTRAGSNHMGSKARNESPKVRGRSRDSPPRYRRQESPAKYQEAPKIPERHTLLLPESVKFKTPALIPRKPSPPQREREDTEARFERQAAAMRKKPPPALPKTKFAFIGRMPFVRKKPEADDPSRKEQDVDTPDPTPPPPPMISRKAEPPKMEIPMPILTNKTKLEAAKEILNKSQSYFQKRMDEPKPVDPVVMDTDMDVAAPGRASPIFPPLPPRMAAPVLPPEVTKNLGKRTMAIPLPREFEEALSIIYSAPKENSPQKPNPPLPPMPPPAPKMERPRRMATPSPPRVPRVPSPPPAPYVDSNDFDIPVPPPPPNSFDFLSLEESMALNYDDDDEMAMLGIDKADMAALRF